MKHSNGGAGNVQRALALIRGWLGASVCFLVGGGLVLVVYFLTWVMIAERRPLTEGEGKVMVAGVVAFLAGLASFFVTQALRDTSGKTSTSDEDYGRAMLGLGYVMALAGTINIVAFAGFLKGGTIVEMFKAEQADVHPLIPALRLVLSLGMAILGALFFLTNSLRRERVAGGPFNYQEFWGLVAYRLGEALLFTVVIFLVLRSQNRGDQLLPLIALCLGMFVTTGETLVFGIAQRVLQGAAAMVGETSKPGGTATGVGDTTEQRALASGTKRGRRTSPRRG